MGYPIRDSYEMYAQQAYEEAVREVGMELIAERETNKGFLDESFGKANEEILKSMG